MVAMRVSVQVPAVIRPLGCVGLLVTVPLVSVGPGNVTGMFTVSFRTNTAAFSGVNCGVDQTQWVLRMVAQRVDGTSEMKMDGVVYDSDDVAIGEWLWEAD